MNFELDWRELLFLDSLNGPAAYLKMMSSMWGIEINSIVEIGVFHGENSKWLRALFPNAALYLVDPWEIYDEYLLETAGPMTLNPTKYEEAFQLVKKYFSHDPKTQIIRKTSMEALSLIPDDLDLVFIDGNHSYSYVKQDIENWFPKVRKGGIISGHDYNKKRFPNLVQAVDEFFTDGVTIGNGHTWFKQKT